LSELISLQHQQHDLFVHTHLSRIVPMPKNLLNNVHAALFTSCQGSITSGGKTLIMFDGNTRSLLTFLRVCDLCGEICITPDEDVRSVLSLYTDLLVSEDKNAIF
jgi:hypothetical protein